jgi:hypothetical protein
MMLSMTCSEPFRVKSLSLYGQGSTTTVIRGYTAGTLRPASSILTYSVLTQPGISSGLYMGLRLGGQRRGRNSKSGQNEQTNRHEQADGRTSVGRSIMDEDECVGRSINRIIVNRIVNHQASSADPRGVRLRCRHPEAPYWRLCRFTTITLLSKSR